MLWPEIGDGCLSVPVGSGCVSVLIATPVLSRLAACAEHCKNGGGRPVVGGGCVSV